MTLCALSHVALNKALASDAVIGWRGNCRITHDSFLRDVCAWKAEFARVQGSHVALYFDDAVEFAAALWGAWHAGKHVVLPGDVQPATLQSLLPQVHACAGQFPAQWTTLVAKTCCDEHEVFLQALEPLDLDATHVSMFTSGSSGTPSKIDKTLRQLDAEVQALQMVFGERIGSAHVVATVSHQHIYGLLFRVLWPLAAGRTTDAAMLRYPEQLLQHLSQWPQSVLVSSPALLGRLPAQLPWAEASSGVQSIFSSGGPLPEAAAQQALQYLGHSPAEVFGSSETGGIAWRQRAVHAEIWNLLPGVQCRIQSEGLLEVRSPHLSDPSQWWTTADCANLDIQAQSFCLLGRADRIVKVAEKRVSLTRIEHAVMDSAWVRQARALLLPPSSASATERIGVVLELNEQGWQHLQQVGRRQMGLDLQALVSPCVERVALPRNWRYVERMPMNAQGKCTQQQLATLFRPAFPQLEWLQSDACQASMVWHIAPDLIVFDGHFPEAPLVPGVSQLHWVEWSARKAFDLPAHFLRAEVLKFQVPILPNAQVHVLLQWLPEKKAVQFALTSGAGTHASGRLVWSD